jgi:TRAP transporter TAXI family solute receptor
MAVSGPLPRRARAAVVMLLAAVVAGCAAGGARDLPRANLITGGTGSDWYRIGSAIAERTNVHFPGQPVTAVPGAGGVSNPARVGRLPGDFGISFLAFLRSAYQGDAPYKQAFPELRHVATLLQNKLHLIAGSRLEIPSLEAIRDRRLGVRIGTGPPGSAEEFLLREALVAIGVTYDDIRGWGGRIDRLGSGERADLFRDGHIDLIAFHAADPSALVTELMISHEGRFLPISPAVRRTLRERWGVQELVLAAGLYKQLDTDVDTVGLDFGIFATADVDEALVHALVRSIAENVGYLAKVHTGFQRWEPARMVRSGGVPLHAGAERYFRERGWIAP